MRPEEYEIREMINRIVILNLECYSSIAAIQLLLETLHHRVVLFCASKPIGGKRGTYIEQLNRHLRQSGFYFTQFLALNYVIFSFLRPLRNLFRFKSPKLFSARKLCQEYGIDYVHTANINDPEVVEYLRTVAPDLILSFHFDQIIRSDIIKIPRYGVINVHSAWLPNCRGPLPVFCSLLRKQKLGFTVHYITDSTIDTGPIILRKQVDLNRNDSALLIERNILVQAARTIEDILLAIGNGSETGSAQAGGFYFSFPNKQVMREWHNIPFKLFRFTDFFK